MVQATRPLAALGAEVVAHERAATSPAPAGPAYTLRAGRPGTAFDMVRRCTSALRVLRMDAVFREDGMTTEIVGADGHRLTREELGHSACDEVIALAGHAGWGWWRSGFG